MTLEEVEAQAEVRGSLATSEAVDGEVFEDETIDEDEQARIDIQEGIKLLEEIKTIVDYVRNPNIVKNISKRERDVLGKASENIRVYLASTYPTYMEEPEEEDA